MSRNQILRKLNLYRQNPDIVQPLTNAELADLVVIVLNQVDVIEKSIANKKIDLDKIIGKEAQSLVSNAQQETTALRAELVKQVQDLVAKGESVLSEKSTEVERQVQQAIQNIRDGKDGVVSEADIERAAEVAAAMIELPDFEALVAQYLTADGESVRNALELLQGEDRLDASAVKNLDQYVKTQVVQSGGTIGKQQVVGFIKQVGWLNGSGTTGGKITVSATEPTGAQEGDLWVDIS